MEPIDYTYPSRFSTNILWIFGSWITPGAGVFYTIYGLIMQGIIVFSYMINCGIMLPLADGLQSGMVSFTITIMMTSVSIKMLNFYFKRHQIQEFLDYLNSTENQLNDPDEREIVVKAIKSADRMVKFTVGVYVFAGFSGVLPSFSSDPKVPYPIYYPDWQKDKKSLYISCVYQVFCVLSSTAINACADTILPCFLIVLGGQIDALGLRITKIGGKSSDENVAFEELLECVKRHKHLIKLSEKLQNLFSFVTFVQIFISGFVAVGLLFQLSLTSFLQNTNIYMKIFTFIIAMFFEIYIPCFTANEVKLKSEDLKLTLYTSDWINLNIRLKKLIIFFMQRLKFPILLTVGGTFALGLDTFTSILNSSYSFYTLLRRVNN